jgi:hypothetical protein
MRSMHSRIMLSCVLSVGLAAVAFSQPADGSAPEPEPPQAAARPGLNVGHLFSLGIQGDRSNDEGFGIGGRLVVHPDKYVGLEFVGTFDYFFPEDDWFSEDPSGWNRDETYFEAGVMTVYKFKDPEDAFRPYLGLGLNFAHSKETTQMAEYGISDTWSSTETEWNLTAGALFGRGRTKLFVELRSSLEGGHTLVWSAGLRFGGHPARKARRSAARPEPELVDEGEPASAEEPETATDISRRACPARDIGFRARTDKSTHPTPEPAAGKALVYILRPAIIGSKIQTRLAVDGEWVGTNRGRNYFFLNLDPGTHYLCSKSENRSVLAVRLEAGKTYFVEQKVSMGIMKARNKLVLLSDSDGREKLAVCHPTVFEQKE